MPREETKEGARSDGGENENRPFGDIGRETVGEGGDGKGGDNNDSG